MDKIYSFIAKYFYGSVETVQNCVVNSPNSVYNAVIIFTNYVKQSSINTCNQVAQNKFNSVQVIMMWCNGMLLGSYLKPEDTRKYCITIALICAGCIDLYMYRMLKK